MSEKKINSKSGISYFSIIIIKNEKKHQTNVKKLTYKFGIVKKNRYICNVNKDKKESSNKKGCFQFIT